MINGRADGCREMETEGERRRHVSKAARGKWKRWLEGITE